MFHVSSNHLPKHSSTYLYHSKRFVIAKLAHLLTWSFPAPLLYMLEHLNLSSFILFIMEVTPTLSCVASFQILSLLVGLHIHLSMCILDMQALFPIQLCRSNHNSFAKRSGGEKLRYLKLLLLSMTCLSNFNSTSTLFRMA